MSLARVQSLSISFGDNPVLHDASFAIDSDQRIALVGRNGTGKSTLLKMLARRCGRLSLRRAWAAFD